MENRHLYELMSRLDRVQDIGIAEVRVSELLKWYSQERVTKKIWRDILTKWQEIEEDPDHTLFVGLGDGTHALIWGEGLASEKDENGNCKSWFVNIDELANPSRTKDE
ncbi:MAG TPA: hypothetical protein PKA57_00590 [Parvibaculum sp.]|uniref:hypothetical protein n=1 Tax=Parvibaculum sp. TaxID=2024848 RepID=UPI002C4DC3EB|nr:hypothetical protein [Parvibaculum sp.]HMM13093.1 hypothetical protein [Parvibaculum sp.]